MSWPAERLFTVEIRGDADLRGVEQVSSGLNIQLCSAPLEAPREGPCPMSLTVELTHSSVAGAAQQMASLLRAWEPWLSVRRLELFDVEESNDV